MNDMNLIKLSLTEIQPYEKNPRHNDSAVEAVAESIRQCGYVAPIIVDEKYVILAGHTRYKALMRLGMNTAMVIVKAGLTEEQKRKYRILDNKTGEIATWDAELLSIDLTELDFDGFDFGFDLGSPTDASEAATIADDRESGSEEVAESESKYDFSDFDAENDSMTGMEDVSINIVVPKKYEAAVREYLKNGEPDTAPGRGRGVMKLCGLL